MKRQRLQDQDVREGVRCSLWSASLLAVLMVLMAGWVTSYKLSLYNTHANRMVPQARFAQNSVEKTLPKVVPPAAIVPVVLPLGLASALLVEAPLLRQRLRLADVPRARLYPAHAVAVHSLFHRPPPTL